MKKINFYCIVKLTITRQNDCIVSQSFTDSNLTSPQNIVEITLVNNEIKKVKVSYPDSILKSMINNLESLEYLTANLCLFNNQDKYNVVLYKNNWTDIFEISNS